VPIAHQIPVEGGGLSWEEVGDFEPIPRLYLSESDGAALQAHLRFGYGPYELPFDKDLPESSTRRKPESRTLVRLRRRPEREQAAFDALSGFHLKRGSEPGQFTLRLRTDPVDFLLHQVPRLAAAGFEVYGEEALTAARVNRSSPTLSLSVSSGIDWFDVKAVVHFGEIEASLTEIRRAIRRRERYVKLADGSIGQIPTSGWKSTGTCSRWARRPTPAPRCAFPHIT
jgi:non-specific serine/threonine protein kinase